MWLAIRERTIQVVQAAQGGHEVFSFLFNACRMGTFELRMCAARSHLGGLGVDTFRCGGSPCYTVGQPRLRFGSREPGCKHQTRQARVISGAQRLLWREPRDPTGYGRELPNRRLDCRVSKIAYVHLAASASESRDECPHRRTKPLLHP